MKTFYHLWNFFILTGALNPEDSTECSDNQKEENVDGQDNVDKCKVEIKIEQHDEKEIFIKKEIKEVYTDILDILIELELDLLLKINNLLSSFLFRNLTWK